MKGCMQFVVVPALLIILRWQAGDWWQWVAAWLIVMAMSEIGGRR